MILLHRLKGEPLFINTDLVESIEQTPDTVVTLVDGRKVVVAESPEQIVDRIIRFRADVLSATDECKAAPAPPLTVLRGGDRS